MTRRPANLVYGVDDRPPTGTTFLLAIQHLLTTMSTLVVPVIFVQEMGMTPVQGSNFISLSLLAMACATLLQSRRYGPLGSGFLMPAITGTGHLPLWLVAGASGGLSLALGMNLLLGLFISFLGRLMKRLRSFFPTEVCGVVIFIMGLSLVKMSVIKVLGVSHAGAPLEPKGFLIGGLSLMVMVGLSIRTKGYLRLFSVAFGFAVGYAVSIIWGVLDATHWDQLARVPLLAFPSWEHTGFSFSATLILPCLVLAMLIVVDGAGLVIACQQANDPDWKRPELSQVSGGLLAIGVGDVVAALLGSMGVGASTANVGLAIASGATSRRIGYFLAPMMAVMAFSPKVATILTLTPSGVIGASLVYTACFMITAGVKLAAARMLDNRKAFMVGLSVIAGMSVEVAPDLFRHVPEWLRAVFGSSLALGAVTAVSLNALFRIGIANNARLELPAQLNHVGDIYDFMENHGATWGARREVFHKATTALNELFQLLVIPTLAQSPITLDVKFDEILVIITVNYTGRLPDLPRTKPTPDEILENTQGLLKLSGYLVQEMADKIQATTNGAQCQIKLFFEH